MKGVAAGKTDDEEPARHTARVPLLENSFRQRVNRQCKRFSTQTYVAIADIAHHIRLRANGAEGREVPP